MGNDVDFDYTDADYQNLTTYKLFQQTYRSRIQSANPKVPQPKLMMLLAAKWREFQAMGSANDEGEAEEEVEEEEEEVEEEEDEDRRRSSKKSRSNGTGSAAKSKKSSGRTAGIIHFEERQSSYLENHLGGRSGKRSKNASS